MNDTNREWVRRCEIKAAASSAVCDMLLAEHDAIPELSEDQLLSYVTEVVMGSAHLMYTRIISREEHE